MTHPTEQELAEQAAVFRLAILGKSHPELRKAEARARIVLAQRIMERDDAEDAGDEAGDEAGRRLQRALVDYRDALASLVRGGEDSEPPVR